jgi:hypothetical protein
MARRCACGASYPGTRRDGIIHGSSCYLDTRKRLDRAAVTRRLAAVAANIGFAALALIMIGAILRVGLLLLSMVVGLIAAVTR